MKLLLAVDVLAGYDLDLGVSVIRNQCLDKAASNPSGTVMAYVFNCAGYANITNDMLAAAERVLHSSMAQHHSMTPLAVAEFTNAVLEFAAEHGDEEEAEAASSRMTDMLALCYDSANWWHSSELLMSAAACACGVPAYYPQDMQRLMAARDELMQRFELVGQYHSLFTHVLMGEVFEACQQLGEQLLPELAAVA